MANTKTTPAKTSANKPSTNFVAEPLFDSHRYFQQLHKNQLFSDDNPSVELFVRSVPVDDAIDDYKYTKEFLQSKGRRNEATYNLFRGETEKFLLWSWLIAKKSVVQLKRRDLESYIDFIHKPPVDWISDNVYRRFDNRNGVRSTNDSWRPFTIKIPKSQRNDDIDFKKKKQNYQCSQDALKATFSTLNVYYDYLVTEDYAFGNAIASVKKDCPYVIKNSSFTEVKRLSSLQWDFILESTIKMASENVDHERTLFIIACLKTLYLRVSELSERNNWVPVMGHFWQDSDKNHWFKVFGKGAKQRDVTVPDSFLPYLERYRATRGLSGYPLSSETDPLVHKLKGSGGMTSRQLRRIVQQAFDNAYNDMIRNGFKEEAQTLKEATTHWLRHTGASMDIDSRPLKHMADELGHASMGTTDRVYVQSDHQERAKSGKKRVIESK
ncbi:site-specific integrase [Thalassotalea sp. HSM 43]|uniref:tyrosine-type recombinase/integrase n=1 Tax=Thalassotalea sp. HSM 43 TaxID=2552945 RepID=UPI0010808AC1|nr:site-specific integrase [Thalassotalea sp. HSM 43]QBY06008.1 site-specific integrase [Thalassotalea sp. HSM 43]